MKNDVLFILSVPPPYGGGEIASENLYSKIKNKYDCFIFSKKYFTKKRQSSFNLLSVYYSINYIFRVCVKIITSKPKKIYIGLPKGFLPFLRNSIVIRFASLLKIKVFSELHGMSFPFETKSPKKKLFLISTLNKISKIRVLSNSTKDYLINELQFKGTLYKINNGIHSSKSSLKIKNRKNVIPFNILYFGSISIEKGFKRTLLIFKELVNNYNSNIHLNVIGEWANSQEKNELMNYISLNDLSKHISFYGRIIGDRKWSLLANNHVLLHLTSFDGQPLTIIETMSIGIPSITTKIGGIPEMIENDINGFLIDNDHDVSDIISKLTDSKDLYNKISEESISHYNNNFTTEKMVTSIIDMVNN